MNGPHLLDKDHRPVPCTMHEWAEWMRASPEGNRVDFTDVGDVHVSTVFLYFDHNWSGEGPPRFFETMIFGGKFDENQFRCSTWEEAKLQHSEAVAMVRRRGLRVV